MAWSEGRWPLGAAQHSPYEPSDNLCYDDSTINIVVVIIIIIIIIMVSARVSVRFRVRVRFGVGY